MTEWLLAGVDQLSLTYLGIMAVLVLGAVGMVMGTAFLDWRRRAPGAWRGDAPQSGIRPPPPPRPPGVSAEAPRARQRDPHRTSFMDRLDDAEMDIEDLQADVQFVEDELRRLRRWTHSAALAACVSVIALIVLSHCGAQGQPSALGGGHEPGRGFGSDGPTGSASSLPALVSAPERELVHAYARVFVGEAGWTNAIEHAALAHTLRRRAERLHLTRGWSEIETIRRYSTANTVRPRTARGMWVVTLPLDGVTEPAGWPANVHWTNHAPLWREALARAAAHVRGELADPCSGPSEHWGSREHPVDVARARRALGDGRWRRVGCGPTKNAFFAIRGRR